MPATRKKTPLNAAGKSDTGIWIDENDEIFDELAFWENDCQGADLFFLTPYSPAIIWETARVSLFT